MTVALAGKMPTIRTKNTPNSSITETEQGMEDGQELYVEISVEGDAAHDHYNFQFQFPCYILGDELQALGFKRLIMDEIRYHGGFCDPADRTDFAS